MAVVDASVCEGVTGSLVKEEVCVSDMCTQLLGLGAVSKLGFCSIVSGDEVDESVDFD
jgi:hypothetical protein